MASRGLAASLRAARAGDRTNGHRHQFHGRSAALSRQRAPGNRSADPVRDPLRLGLRRVLDGDGGLRPAACRSRPLRHLAYGERACIDRPVGAHRDRDADLQRGCAARLRGTARDLRIARRAPASSQHFDFFVLSDSSNPDARVAEIAAWLALCRAVDGFGRVFYRWRQHRIKRKSGNIADFCRRWGSNYRYMVVLDADSVMSGDCLTALVRIAEANPTCGIVQTAPRAAGRETLYARMQQFATGVYGPLFTAGLHFWQLGESHYWGHNAIIRVAPFMRYCALGPVAGKGRAVRRDPVARFRRSRADASGRLGGMDRLRSAGQLRGNAAQPDRRTEARSPLVPGQPDELPAVPHERPASGAPRRVHDRRDGLPVRAAVVRCSSFCRPLLLAVHTLVPPTYFIEPNQLFPLWPEWHPEWAIALVGATAILLFLPKVLGTALLGVEARASVRWRLRLAMSTALEMVMSALLAPIRMLFHTRFVVMALLGWSVSWKSPPRDDNETSWGEALSRHGLHTLLGIAWAAGVYWLESVLPVVAAAGRRRADCLDTAVGLYQPRDARTPFARATHFPDSGRSRPAAGNTCDAPLPGDRPPRARLCRCGDGSSHQCSAGRVGCGTFALACGRARGPGCLGTTRVAARPASAFTGAEVGTSRRSDCAVDAPRRSMVDAARARALDRRRQCGAGSIALITIGQKRVSENVLRDATPLQDAFGLVERPVNAEVDAALPVLFLGLREG